MSEPKRKAGLPQSTNAATGLVRYDEMRRAVEAAHSVDEVKDIRDKAAAMEAYFRMAQDPQPERQACDIRLRSERRAGQLLKQIEKAKGARGRGPGRGKKGSHAAEQPFSETKTLAEHGVTRNQSATWQKLADVPEEDFEAALAAPEKPTTSGIIAGTSIKRERKFGQPGQSPEERAARSLWLGVVIPVAEGVLDFPAGELFGIMTEKQQRELREAAPLLVRYLQEGGFGDE